MTATAVKMRIFPEHKDIAPDCNVIGAFWIIRSLLYEWRKHKLKKSLLAFSDSLCYNKNISLMNTIFMKRG